VHGYDGGKKVSGRKRHLLVDTLGIVLKVLVTAASTGDRDGAAVLLDGIRAEFPRLSHGWADQGYRGPFLDWARQVAGVALQVVVRRDGGMRRSRAPAGAPPRVVPRFAVVPRRWVVERTFAWLGRYRRLSKDYEYLPVTSENAIYLAMRSPCCAGWTGRAVRAGPAAAALTHQHAQPARADRSPSGLSRAFQTPSSGSPLD
jgi:transposase